MGAGLAARLAALLAPAAVAMLASGCAARETEAPGASAASSAREAAASRTAAPLAVDPGRTVTMVHGALGALFELTIAGVAEADARRLLDDAAAEIDRVEDALGGWRDDTDLARLNREGAAGPVPASPRLLDAIERALALNRATEGAFDVTVAPLVDAYGLRRGQARLPPPDELARLRACVGPERLRLDADARTIAFDRPGVAVDLDGLNKGIAVDRVIARLRAAGVTDATISAGGSTIGSIGPPAESPARQIAIAGPEEEIHARVELRDAVLSTSGNWRHFVVVDGRTYGAIFDPRTGEPVENEVVSATAVASRGDESETFAKAAVVLGEAGAARLAREQGVRFVLLLRDPAADGRIVVTRHGR